jgi:putative membrane-bound dehydrogenase-like protein
MTRRFLPLLALLALPSAAAAQGFPPEEAARRMQLPPGFTARVVAAEPMIRQPVSIEFDDRGRMWVLQYLQYPNYAGLKPLKQDQYLRTVWDKVPEPPPFGPKGADRLTICYDPDENGVYRKSKDFVSGLNIASGFCLGHGGVYVVQPPYLLFYPDKDGDDVPDGDPEVLLSGFGMDDTHSLANSLQWGPDGWLYGAAGSTSTCKITNPIDPKAPPVEFQQGIWRFHPKTRQFELFSEGGGNTYGLDFDKHGQVIAGTNWGGFAMLHQMQGAYYVKGFAKHGPLHYPHTYGYFEHVPYTGFKGGHVTCGGIVYQADAFPPEYRDQYVAGNLLSNAVYWHKLEPVGSSFKASHGGDLLVANDTWFRPIDLMLGPDGSVFVADWYDKRAAHLDPVDNWDKTNGRVYKIEYKGTPKVPPFDLRKKSAAEVVELLKHPNKWWRNEARRILAERQDKSTHVTLRRWLFTEKGDLALESLWALYVSGGWQERDYDYVGNHPNEHVRAWAVRFLGDDGEVSEITAQTLNQLARSDPSPVVLAQIACSARRFPPELAMDLMSNMLENPLASRDAQLPLLMWWAQESANARDKADVVRFPYPQPPNESLRDFFGERVARRLLAGDIPRGETRCSTLFELTRGANADYAPLLRGIAAALQTRPLDEVPPPLVAPLTTIWNAKPRDLLVLEVLARMNHKPARAALRTIVADTAEADAVRVKAADLLRQVRDAEAKALFLAQFPAAKSDALRIGLLAGLEGYDDPAIGEFILAGYPGYSPAVKKRAIQTLLTRPAWALLLVRQLDAGKLPKADFTLDHAKAAVALNDKDVTALVEKHYGKLAPATAGEKQARIAALNLNLSRLPPGDAARGKPLFVKHCAACHILHGEGGKVGPDLTTADRKNRTYLLTQIVDPSGYIRPEYVVYNVTTLDGRKLSGIVTESGGESVTLVNVVNDQPQKTTVSKADIDTMTPSAVSLMPEKLLDTLTDAEIADLLAYVASDAPVKTPVANAPGSPRPADKKLKVCFVSGSFEYKSDESLTLFKKYLEAKYPVECTIVSAKAEKDKELPGLEALDTCDVAVFFTRRLQIEGESLERVKKFAASGKPVIGIRTASHGFQNYLQMDKDVFGGDYQNHFGQNVECSVTIAEKGKDHPVLAGVKPFKTTGGLYKNPNVAADVTVLLTGTIPNQPTQPVAWVREKDGRRVFYTSLGHPDDFKDENFLRLLVNALAWTTKTELKAVQ